MKLACLLATASLLLALVPAAGAAQSAPYTEGSVWNMSFIRTKPGMRDVYLNNLRANWRRELEEAKRQGLVRSYRVISAQAATPGDWDLLLIAEYKSLAALDSADAKFRAIDTKLFGTEQAQQAGVSKRAEVREILGDKQGRELILRDTTITASRP